MTTYKSLESVSDSIHKIDTLLELLGFDRTINVVLGVDGDHMGCKLIDSTNSLVLVSVVVEEAYTNTQEWATRALYLAYMELVKSYSLVLRNEVIPDIIKDMNRSVEKLSENVASGSPEEIQKIVADIVISVTFLREMANKLMPVAVPESDAV